MYIFVSKLPLNVRNKTHLIRQSYIHQSNWFIHQFDQFIYRIDQFYRLNRWIHHLRVPLHMALCIIVAIATMLSSINAKNQCLTTIASYMYNQLHSACDYAPSQLAILATYAVHVTMQLYYSYIATTTVCYVQCSTHVQ